MLAGEPGSAFAVVTRAFVGEPVDYAMRDARTGRPVRLGHVAVLGTADLVDRRRSRGDWTPAEGLALPKGGTQALRRIWVIAAGEEDGLMYAGGDPGVLFCSRDDGATWQLNTALWEHPTRPRWRRDSGGLSVHSIAPGPATPTASRSRSPPPASG